MAAGVGALLGGCVALWMAGLGVLRRVRERERWKSRMEAALEEHGRAIQRLETKLEGGFSELLRFLHRRV